MTLADLKTKIESKSSVPNFMIFKCTDNTFAARQYYRTIAKNAKIPIEVIVDPLDLVVMNTDIFNINNITRRLKVCLLDEKEELTTLPEGIEKATDTIIVCFKIDKELQTVYSNYIFEFPKLKDEHILDYTYSHGAGISTDCLRHLIKICKNDIYRISIELDKLNIFNKTERDSIFNLFINDNVFSDLTDTTMFNFTNAIMQRNKSEICRIYKDLKLLDISEMGILTTLYNEFKKIILIQLNPHATYVTTGIPEKQFNVIRNYNLKKYTDEQLPRIFEIITDIDRKLKTGELDKDLIIDYLLVNILGV